MAFALVQSKFLGVLDLKYGVWIYGALMTILGIYYTVVPELNYSDWILYVGVSAPAMALFVMQLVFPDSFAYAWANWYFSFFAFILDTVFIIMQTILILQLKGEIGEG